MFKKIRLLILYINILKNNREKLKIEHGLHIDWVYRMYKTYTVPSNELDNIKIFGFKYFDNLIKKEISNIDKDFIRLGLSELCGIMEVKELNNNQVGIAFRFKYLDTAKIFKRIFWSLLYIVSGVMGFFINSFFGIFLGLLIILIIYLFMKIII